MQQALEALDAYSWEQVKVAANALRDRLAQPEQKENWQYVQQLNAFSYPRPWVGLTEEEIKECFKVTPDLFLPWHIYSRIEAKLKDKNT
jgi:hypothetical protein